MFAASAGVCMLIDATFLVPSPTRLPLLAGFVQSGLNN